MDGLAVRAPNKIYRAARAIVLIALAATAIIGLLHTKAAKPLLQRLGGCPAGFATRDDVDNVRKYAIAMSPGEGASPARPALGFVLDKTTEDDVLAWAAKNKVACEENSRLGQLTCTAVPAALLGDPNVLPIEELTLAFSPTKKLVNILALRHGLTSDAASSVFTARMAHLQTDLGVPAHQVAPTEPGFFDKELLRTALVDYKFKDYQCEVSATTMLDRTVTVREHYLSTL